jgi:hypothetical protein
LIAEKKDNQPNPFRSLRQKVLIIAFYISQKRKTGHHFKAPFMNA